MDKTLHHLLLASIILFTSATARAQAKMKLEFLAPPERMVVSEPEADPSSEDPCTIVVELTIDRDGRVLKALSNAALSQCTDLGALIQAAQLAREYKFERSSAAPEQQKARMTWTVGNMGFDDVAVPEPEPPPPGVIEENKIYDIAMLEEMPEFPGGEQALYTYLAKNLKYPTDLEHGFQGKVYVEFIVSATGDITDVKVLRGIGSALDAEAIRVVKSMPKWKPGRVNGRNVSTRFRLPIVFKVG